MTMIGFHQWSRCTARMAFALAPGMTKHVDWRLGVRDKQGCLGHMACVLLFKADTYKTNDKRSKITQRAMTPPGPLRRMGFG